MALPRFFKTPKNQRFDYVPQYYDSRKEDLERRLKNAKDAKDGDPEAVKARISSGFRRKQKGYTATKRAAGMRRNLSLIAIIVALILISYILLTVYLPRIVDMVE